MSEPATDTSLVAAGVGVLSLVITGLTLLLRAAFKVGADTRASERIAADLAEVKGQLRTLIDQHTARHQELLERVFRLEARVHGLEAERHSRPGE